MSALSQRGAFQGSALAFLGLLVACGGAQVVDPARPTPDPSAEGAGAPIEGAPPRALQPATDPPPRSAAIAATDPDPRRDPEASAGVCGGRAIGPQPLRRGGNLTVESPPRQRSRDIGSRMRADIDGPLSAQGPRFWVGMEVPTFVQIASGTLELFLLDKVTVAAPPLPEGAAPEGFLAFYRDPYDASSCALSGSNNAGNCAYGAALYHCSGKLLWVVTLNPFLSRPDQLEIQDVRYDGGVLYFNEGCQTYSKDAGGRCSSLVALDPVAKNVLWRSAPRTSNNAFVIHGQYILAGYGFTDEPDFLYVVRRSDGKVMQRVPVSTAHQQINVERDGTVSVVLYDGAPLRFMAQGFDGASPKLVKLSARDPLGVRR